MACVLRLLEIKARHNLTDDAFCQIMIAINGNDASLYQIKNMLKSIVPIMPIWVDMYPNFYYVYTRSYKDHDECEHYYVLRFWIEKSGQKRYPQRQMAYFSIKDHLIIQYQDPTHSEELRYHASYT